MLRAHPLTFKQANDYVRDKHRHHKPVVGCKFVVGARKDAELVGVAIVGRPVARKIDHTKVLEVNRLCADGSKNVCSFLYSRCARIAAELGYEKIITYILATETGVSLAASGWVLEGETPGLSWNVPSRPREDNHPIVKKFRYSKMLT